VARETVQELLALASRSASGSNIQPWKVHVCAGEVRERLSATILQALDRDGPGPYQREWNYYPVNWREPYIGRRRRIGWGLYRAAGHRQGRLRGHRAPAARELPLLRRARGARVHARPGHWRSAAGWISASSSAA
jgi:nitroreductase